MVILNVLTPNSRTTKYRKQNPTEGTEKQKTTVTVGDSTYHF